jgi:hypothetical protein
MEVITEPNSVTLKLRLGEGFFFKAAALRGIREFEWRWLPPFPLGSIIARLIHGWYLFMREAEAVTSERTISLKGAFARGNFYCLTLEEGELVFVSGHSVVGFSRNLTDLHTNIRFGLNNWFLHYFFFPVFRGPGQVLLYSRSPIERTMDMDLLPDRVIAFDARRAFRAVAPRPNRPASYVANLFARDVLWHFIEPGWTIAERHNVGEEEDYERGLFLRCLEHVLAFIRFPLP